MGIPWVLWKSGRMVCTQGFCTNKVDLLFRGHREPAPLTPNYIIMNSCDFIIRVTVGGVEEWEDGLYSGVLGQKHK